MPPSESRPPWSWKRALVYGGIAFVGTYLAGTMTFAALFSDGHLRDFGEAWARTSLYGGAVAFGASWLRQTGRRDAAWGAVVAFTAIAIAILAVALIGDEYKPKRPPVAMILTSGCRGTSS